jgi:hypothetical protein
MLNKDIQQLVIQTSMTCPKKRLGGMTATSFRRITRVGLPHIHVAISTRLRSRSKLARPYI